jgi:hypothetical protein
MADVDSGCGELLSHYRQARGEPYWDNFDFLVEKIREYNRSEGGAVKTWP